MNPMLNFYTKANFTYKNVRNNYTNIAYSLEDVTLSNEVSIQRFKLAASSSLAFRYLGCVYSSNSLFTFSPFSIGPFNMQTHGSFYGGELENNLDFYILIFKEINS